jgi:hypothetical protein
VTEHLVFSYCAATSRLLLTKLGEGEGSGVQSESGVVVSYLARLASRPFGLVVVVQWLARGVWRGVCHGMRNRDAGRFLFIVLCCGKDLCLPPRYLL